MLNHVLRYAPVLSELDERPPSSLLEVGSGSRGIAPYLTPAIPLTLCDVAFDDYGSDRPAAPLAGTSRIVGSVLDLPFATASFDTVLALDLLEHLPSADRARALAELGRVAGRRLIVGCPTGQPALRADRWLARFIGRLGRPLPGWLTEHLCNGFPEPAELTALAERGGRATVLANEWATSHALVCALEATPLLWRVPLTVGSLLQRARGGALEPLAAAVLRLLSAGDREPRYRTIVIVDRAAPGLRST